MTCSSSPEGVVFDGRQGDQVLRASIASIQWIRWQRRGFRLQNDVVLTADFDELAGGRGR